MNDMMEPINVYCMEMASAVSMMNQDGITPERLDLLQHIYDTAYKKYRKEKKRLKREETMVEAV